jgi:hypothetical protein
MPVKILEIFFSCYVRENIFQRRNYFRSIRSFEKKSGSQVPLVSLRRDLPPLHTFSIGDTPYFGDGPIRAFYGLRFAIFPEPEAIIPENKAIILTPGGILRRMGEVIPGNIREAEN